MLPCSFTRYHLAAAAFVWSTNIAEAHTFEVYNEPSHLLIPDVHINQEYKRSIVFRSLIHIKINHSIIRLKSGIYEIPDHFVDTTKI